MVDDKSKKNEIELSLYRDALKNSRDIVIMFNSEGEIIDVNKSAISAYGYSEEELLKMNIFQLRYNSKNCCDMIQKQFDIAKQKGLDFQTYHCTKEGLKFPAEVKSTSIQIEGSKIVVLSIVRDITDRLKKEEEIRRYASIVEYSDDAILSKNLDGIITSWNIGAEKLYGYKKHEIIGEHISKIIPDESKVDIDFILNKIKKGECVHYYETVRLTKLGQKKHVSIKVSPIFDYENNVIGASSIARDITEKINIEKELIKKNEDLSIINEEYISTEEELRQNYSQLEEAVKEAEKANMAKTQFLANMSHEIRTPLNAISGMIDLLAFTKLDYEQKQFIEMLKASTSSLVEIINSVLDLSKIEAGKFEINLSDFDLKKILSRVINELTISCNQKKLYFEYFIDEDIPFNLIGDAVKLNQILTNLISNAVKFTDIGYIKFMVSKKYQDKDKVILLFSIEDSGIGIEDNFKDQVFNKFVQQDVSYNKKFSGTGLGLAISKQLAKMLNGDIWLESRANFGSTFYFKAEFIMHGNKIVTTKEIKQENNINTCKDKVILIVEDNLINMKIASTIIKNMGHNYIEAYNGLEALETLEKKNVDLILMDIQMPILNGYDATKKIREDEKHNDIPIIAMTAYSMVGDRELFLESGMDDYISKPYSNKTLTDVINRHLQK